MKFFDLYDTHEELILQWDYKYDTRGGCLSATRTNQSR